MHRINMLQILSIDTCCHVLFFDDSLTCVEDKDIALPKLASVSDVTLVQITIFLNHDSLRVLMMLMYSLT